MQAERLHASPSVHIRRKKKKTDDLQKRIIQYISAFKH
jgi:hypothetical protein